MSAAPKGRNILAQGAEAVKNLAGADLQVCEIIENGHLKVCAGPSEAGFFHSFAALGCGALTPPSAPLSRPGGRGEGGEGRCLNPGLTPWAMLSRSFDSITASAPSHR